MGSTWLTYLAIRHSNKTYIRNCFMTMTVHSLSGFLPSLLHQICSSLSCCQLSLQRIFPQPTSTFSASSLFSRAPDYPLYFQDHQLFLDRGGLTHTHTFLTGFFTWWHHNGVQLHLLCPFAWRYNFIHKLHKHAYKINTHNTYKNIDTEYFLIQVLWDRNTNNYY